MPGPKAGALIAKLREEAGAGDTAPEKGAPAAGGTTDAKPEGTKPAAAGYTEDEEAVDADARVWSEAMDTVAGDAKEADDASDDGTIDKAIG